MTVRGVTVRLITSAPRGAWMVMGVMGRHEARLVMGDHPSIAGEAGCLKKKHKSLGGKGKREERPRP